MKRQNKKRTIKTDTYHKPHMVKVSIDDLRKEIFSADEIACIGAFSQDRASLGGACCA